VRGELKKRAVAGTPCRIPRATPCGRAVEISIARSDKRIRVIAVCAIEGKQDINASLRGDTKQSALLVFAPEECRAEEVAVGPGTRSDVGAPAAKGVKLL